MGLNWWSNEMCLNLYACVWHVK